MAPCQTSLVSEGHTLFAKALFDAFNGGSMQPDHPIVTVEDLFKVVHKSVKAKVAAMKKAAEAAIAPPLAVVAVEPGADPAAAPPAAPPAPDATALAAVNAINQSPVIIIPHGKHHQLDYLRNPVCFKCGPPAPPEKPFVSLFPLNDVALV